MCCLCLTNKCLLIATKCNHVLRPIPYSQHTLCGLRNWGWRLLPQKYNWGAALHQCYSPAGLVTLRDVGGEPDLRSVQQPLPRPLPGRNVLSLWVYMYNIFKAFLHLYSPPLCSSSSSASQTTSLYRLLHRTRRCRGHLAPSLSVDRNRKKKCETSTSTSPHIDYKQRHCWHRETFKSTFCGFYFHFSALFK